MHNKLKLQKKNRKVFLILHTIHVKVETEFEIVLIEFSTVNRFKGTHLRQNTYPAPKPIGILYNWRSFWRILESP